MVNLHSPLRTRARVRAVLAQARQPGGVEALILHRHVGHAGERGLNLGSWSRVQASMSTPHEPRRLQALFRVCGSPGGGPALDAALARAGERARG